MVNFDKETMMIVAVIACLAACFYLYKESKTQSQDITTIRTYLQRQSQALSNDTKEQKVDQTSNKESVADEEEEE